MNIIHSNNDKNNNAVRSYADSYNTVTTPPTPHACFIVTIIIAIITIIVTVLFRDDSDKDAAIIYCRCWHCHSASTEGNMKSSSAWHGFGRGICSKFPRSEKEKRSKTSSWNRPSQLQLTPMPLYRYLLYWNNFQEWQRSCARPTRRILLIHVKVKVNLMNTCS